MRRTLDLDRRGLRCRHLSQARHVQRPRPVVQLRGGGLANLTGPDSRSGAAHGFVSLTVHLLGRQRSRHARQARTAFELLRSLPALGAAGSANDSLLSMKTRFDFSPRDRRVWVSSSSRRRSSSNTRSSTDSGSWVSVLASAMMLSQSRWFGLAKLHSAGSGRDVAERSALRS